MIVVDPFRLGGIDLNIFSVVAAKQRWEMAEAFSRLDKGRSDHGLMLLLSGSAEYTDSDGSMLSAKAGDVIYVPKGKRYTVRFREGTENVLINFLMSDGMGRGLMLGDDIFCVAHSASREIKKRFAAIADSYRGSGEPFSQKAEMYRLLGLLLTPAHESADVIERCVAYIDSHYGELEGVAGLAEMCGYGETAFRKKFREKMGMSPVHYINAVKVERACRMLLGNEITVGSICEALGFYDTAYFHKVFKKYTGKTPGEYCKEAGTLRLDV